MRNFKIKGRILANQSPNQGIPGLRVEAWDKDLLFHDRLGSAITDPKGEFMISFSESDFNDLFFDKYPDVFFKVYAGETLLKDTRRSTQWNVGIKERDIYEMPDIFVDYVVEQPPIEVPQTGERGSTRSIFKATYTPRKTKTGEADAPNTRGLEKGRFIASLNPSPEEIKLLLEKSVGSKNEEKPDKLKSALSIISSSIRVDEKINILKHAKQFAQIDLPTLWQFADELIAKRAENVKPGEQGQKALNDLAQMRKNVALAKENFKVVPVGYLHLEKMSFTPAGIERGELVYSLPLAPGEEVNIAHKEWSRTSEEFERLVTDYMEDFSEEGVAEKSEFADAVNTQSQNSEAYNLSVSASGSYGGFSISSSFGYNASDSSSKSQQTSRKQSHDITQKASSRVTKEHKVSFKVASASEVEDQNVRKIVNPFKDRATRVDYYQLIRKWEVNLYRYGMRLSWDLAIPEPGSGLLSKIAEINDIKKQLEKTFDDFFAIKPSEIDSKSLLDYIAQFNAPINEEEILYESISKTDIQNRNFKVDPAGTVNIRIPIEVSIPEGYRVSKASIGYAAQRDDVSEWGFLIKNLIGNQQSIRNLGPSDISGTWINGDVNWSELQNYWDKKTGVIAYLIGCWRIEFYTITLTIEMEMTTEAKQQWEIKMWNILRDSAITMYNDSKRMLNEKLEALNESMGLQDALTLRKKEREEIMKGVLRWMEIEGMEFFPSEIIPQPGGEMDIENELYDDATGLVRKKDKDGKDVNIYNPIMAQGEIIKFLHQAIEWENMLYFLYPYFWTHPTRWEFKKYLDHPDPQHKAFLKAGSARVVLTIRPGFEHAFLTFKDTGEMDGLPKYPYLTIGEEYRHFAQTNYPGIPPANPVKNYRPQLSRNQQKAWQDMQHIMQLLEEYSYRPFKKQREAWQQIKTIIQYLEEYYQINGVYPSGLDQMRLPNDLQRDLWGNVFDYKTIKEGNKVVEYKLASLGSDNREGGVGEAMDIRSWEEPEKGDYPQTLQQLKSSFTSEEDVPLNDPWDNPYQYKYPGDFGDYDLYSFGADGKLGGEGEDADITSWAEATLIGQWYEYTPTSAMDIAFDEDFKE